MDLNKKRTINVLKLLLNYSDFALKRKEFGIKIKSKKKGWVLLSELEEMELDKNKCPYYPSFLESRLSENDVLEQKLKNFYNKKRYLYYQHPLIEVRSKKNNSLEIIEFKNKKSKDGRDPRYRKNKKVSGYRIKNSKDSWKKTFILFCEGSEIDNINFLMKSDYFKDNIHYYDEFKNDFLATMFPKTYKLKQFDYWSLVGLSHYGILRNLFLTFLNGDKDTKKLISECFIPIRARLSPLAFFSMLKLWDELYRVAFRKNPPIASYKKMKNAFDEELDTDYMANFEWGYGHILEECIFNIKRSETKLIFKHSSKKDQNRIENDINLHELVNPFLDFDVPNK